MISHPTVLYVEDSFDDRYLFKAASQRAGVAYSLRTVENGQEAIDYISGHGRYADRQEFSFPHLILLDLKMPGMDGFGVLRWLRQQEGFKELAVVVFTSSYQQADVSRAHQEGATAFLTKPTGLDNLVQLATALHRCFTGEGVTTKPLQELPQFKRL